ncbi:MAG: DEAD/DEAH box helicase [Planctomycetota bacterium]|nr:MAG: DEAD/DEAH box helicase [Planctomycetota bacterium]
MVLDRFHPAVARWFAERLGEPTPPQAQGWPLIAEGRNVLIAAPTGSGKTLTAFLWALDRLLRQGAALAGATQVLYVSPLRALSNDVQKNLQGPLRELRERHPELPEVRVLVRTGDTPQSERAAMARTPPHVLVTTPESLYILLTSGAGRRMLASVRTVIVDEIHAVVGGKRGSHLALSLERLEALAGPVQRIGLSATQKPVEDVARFLAGVGRECSIVDAGHLRALDLAVEIPPSPLGAVCAHETWEEIYARMAELIQQHRTTLIFVGTRKMAERLSARLIERLGAGAVACHHSSLSRERRFDAEQRLKRGALRALVATASLELGIDIGDIDLVLQVGAARSIAAFLQRVGRAGHGVGRVPKGRAFPLTLEELGEAAALLRAVRLRQLDRLPQPQAPLDILAQQVVGECVAQSWDEDELYARLVRAWPYRALRREDFAAALELHAQGRAGLLHRDRVTGRVRATRRARITAVTSGGAIPDTADYQVLLEPEGTFIGTVNEDFAIESSRGDIFQLGNASWQILKLEPGVLRVADAQGAPPTIPFWFGEGASRTAELSAEIGAVRSGGDRPEWLAQECGLDEGAASALARYIAEGREALGAVPTPECVIAERFFDESGGMQLVLHAPFGGRINRAWGLSLRKRFCRRFGFELQAAANEEAIVLSLGPQHSFPLEEVFDYLHPETAREVLVQALLATPMFTTRWRWNVQRALLLPRFRNGRKVPAPLQRMRADDLLVQAFPAVMACGETLAPGDQPVPMEQPLVRQTVEDCLHEAMDVDGFLEVLRRLRDGRIRRLAVDTPAPSAFARGILAAAPYSFLDDAPLEERRTQAVTQRRVLDARTADALGDLDPAAVARVRAEAWPDPRDAEELHEALQWMGFVSAEEAAPWAAWVRELDAQGRIAFEEDRIHAADGTREPKAVLRGRLEALGPVEESAFTDGEKALLAALESEGVVLRVRLHGQAAWCERRLLARIHAYTLEKLRREIEPVTAAEFLRFLACWQHVDEEYRLDGPAGVAEAVAQLAGFEAPAAAWERNLLRARVRGYRPDWLDLLALRGDVAWGRLWGSGAAAVRATPLCLLPRPDLAQWLGLAGVPAEPKLSWRGTALREALQRRGALFPQELAAATGPLSTDFERGLQELIAAGMLSADSYAALRWLLAPSWKREKLAPATGRWSLFRDTLHDVPEPQFVAAVLLRRYGVLCRRVLERERVPVPWRELVRVLRLEELRGRVRGGRFVAGMAGEHYALPQAVELLRGLRRSGPRKPVHVAAADPLNLVGVLTPDERVPSHALRTVQV